jgi:hypothetical protein
MIMWLIRYILTRPSKRTEQMRLDWHWFWHVDFAEWWHGIYPFPRRPYHPEDGCDLPF